MNSSEYIENAQRTKSTEFFPENVSKKILLSRVRHAVVSLSLIDDIKKALFYGKYNYMVAPQDYKERTLRSIPLGLIHSDEQAAKDIIHGIIGKATEAGELLEALLKTLEGLEQLDLVNLEEEIGDGHWYDAILINALKSTFKNVWFQNIEKLKKRFPLKFTKEGANNRNLEAERKSLENNSKSS